MLRCLRSFPASYLLSLIFLPALHAQYQTQDFRHLTFNVGAGFTTAVGRTSDRLDYGGNFQGGIGYRFSRIFSVMGNVTYNRTGVTRTALNELNQPDGHANIYQLTVDPTFHFPVGERANIYVLVGGGWMRRTLVFTEPVLRPTFIFNPWFGYIGPVYVQANQVLGKVSTNAGMANFGAGLEWPLPNSRAKLFGEARFVRGYTRGTNTTIIPITFGLRW